MSGTASLTVNEAALDKIATPPDILAGLVTGSTPSSTAETALSNGLTFNAGSDNITGITFSLSSLPSVSGAAAGTDFFWVINGSGQLEGHIGTSASDPLGIVLEIGGSTTASAGDSVSPTITGTLTDSFPHASGSGSISVTGINVVASDTDGGTVTGLASVDIVDDVPTAHVDSGNVTEGALLTVAALSGVLSNDVAGADGDSIAGVRAAGNDTTTPVSGGVGTDITGLHGTLHLNADGSYTYQSTPNNITSNTTDVFVYTIKDGDGDLSTTTLTINLADVTLVGHQDQDSGRGSARYLEGRGRSCSRHSNGLEPELDGRDSDGTAGGGGGDKLRAAERDHDARRVPAECEWLIRLYADQPLHQGTSR